MGDKRVAVNRPVEDHGATMPERRSQATKVVVFQCPNGTPARRRSPGRQRPWCRAMLVDAQVSPMKTSVSGLRSSWPSNQAQRRSTMSRRSCSVAWPVFFYA